MKTNRKGFTIIEMLTVFAVIFLVLGIAIPQYCKNKTPQTASAATIADPNAVVTDPNSTPIVVVYPAAVVVIADPNAVTAPVVVIADSNAIVTPPETLVIKFVGVTDGRFELVGEDPKEFADRVDMLKNIAKMKGIDTKKFRPFFRETKGHVTVLKYESK